MGSLKHVGTNVKLIVTFMGTCAPPPEGAKPVIGFIANSNAPRRQSS